MTCKASHSDSRELHQQITINNDRQAEIADWAKHQKKTNRSLRITLRKSCWANYAI